VAQTTTVTQYQTLHFTAGTALPGAPSLQMTLLYDQEKGTLAGTGVITQAVTPPGGRIDVEEIHGRVTPLNSGDRLITLRGAAHEPPMMVVFEFSAGFVTNAKWKGEGVFIYGPKAIGPAPVQGAPLVPAQG
jgi:hypothetical protein